MHRYYQWLTIGFAAMTLLTSCDTVKSMVSGATEHRSSAHPGETELEVAAREQGFVVDDSGTTRLNPPTILEQKEGKPVSSNTLSTVGASADGTGSWIFQNAKSGGHFLVAATSHSGTLGGDMIRRIDLGSSIKEFDYDNDQKGAQGAFIYVPDEMRSAVPNRYVDSEGLFSGVICAFVPGPNKSMIALAGGLDGGVGFVFDPYEEAQAFTPKQIISFPFATNPCRAVYTDKLKKLYVVDVTKTGAKNGQEGVFVADITNDGKPSTASFYLFGPEQKVNNHSVNNFLGIDLYKDVLYLLSGNGRFDNEWDNVVYRVPLNELGEPLFDQKKYTQTHNPTVMSAGCGLSDANLAALAVVETKTGPALLTTGTYSTIAWDISGDELKKIDLNEKRPGVQGINLEDMSRGGLKFAFSPDARQIVQLPHCRSEKNKVKVDSSYTMMAFDMPVFNTADLKLEPSIDAGYRDVLASLKNATYRPTFSMTFRDFAVGSKHIGILGNSASNDSGLGHGGDVAIIDRSKRTNIGFTKPSDSRKAHDEYYGFKLAKDDPKFEGAEQNSHAIIWIP